MELTPPLAFALLCSGAGLTLFALNPFRRAADRLLQRTYATTLFVLALICLVQTIHFSFVFQVLVSPLVPYLLHLFVRGAFRTNSTTVHTSWWYFSLAALVVAPLGYFVWGWLPSVLIHCVYAILLMVRYRKMGFNIRQPEWIVFLLFGSPPCWTILPVLVPLVSLWFGHTIHQRMQQQIQGLRAGQGKSQVLEQKIAFDPLTKLFARGYAREALERRLQQHKPTGVIFLDLDNFKGWNDTYGHDFGDRVLTSVAQAIQNTIRTGDMGVRYAGDEMIVILETGNLKVALSIAESILVQMRSIDLGVERRITASIGVGVANRGETLEGFLNRCDAGTYLAKHAGKNQVKPAPDLESVAHAA
jgi:diguanylate cyclase (GGDEF)-like protein